MGELLGLKDVSDFVVPDGTFYWILLRSGMPASQSTLIFGDLKGHQELFLMFQVLEGPKGDDPKKLWIAAKAKNSELRERYKPQVLASGVINRKGEAISWDSKWFAKNTPSDMKEFIKDELLSAIRIYFPDIRRNGV
jgi:hypothetical protein